MSRMRCTASVSGEDGFRQWECEGKAQALANRLRDLGETLDQPTVKPHMIGLPLPAPVWDPPRQNEDRWDLIARLRWCTIDNQILTEDEVRRRVESLTPQERVQVVVAVYEAMDELVDELEDFPPELPSQLREPELCQIVALGKDWYNTLISSPEMIIYLESQLQPVNLLDILEDI